MLSNVIELRVGDLVIDLSNYSYLNEVIEDNEGLEGIELSIKNNLYIESDYIDNTFFKTWVDVFEYIDECNRIEYDNKIIDCGLINNYGYDDINDYYFGEYDSNDFINELLDVYYNIDDVIKSCLDYEKVWDKLFSDDFVCFDYRYYFRR